MVPVSERALRHRINRKLEDKRLVKTKGTAALEELGAFYLVLERAGERPVVTPNVSIEGLGRELGVLRDWERVLGR